jgi:trk system potassium uptake protein TrkA
VNLDMHIVIAGGGRVGSQTATRLAGDGHSTSVIESHEPTANKIPESNLIEVVIGDAVSPETIEQVPMERADVFAALTGDTNANVAACYIARTGVDSVKTVMRIGSDDEREYSEHDAIDAVVFPEAVGAETATKQILQP